MGSIWAKPDVFIAAARHSVLQTSEQKVIICLQFCSLHSKNVWSTAPSHQAHLQVISETVEKIGSFSGVYTQQM